MVRFEPCRDSMGAGVGGRVVCQLGHASHKKKRFKMRVGDGQMWAGAESPHSDP